MKNDMLRRNRVRNEPVLAPGSQTNGKNGKLDKSVVEVLFSAPNPPSVLCTVIFVSVEQSLCRFNQGRSCS